MGKESQVEKCPSSHSKWQNMEKNLGLPKSKVPILFSELNLTAADCLPGKPARITLNTLVIIRVQ